MLLCFLDAPDYHVGHLSLDFIQDGLSCAFRSILLLSSTHDASKGRQTKVKLSQVQSDQ